MLLGEYGRWVGNTMDTMEASRLPIQVVDLDNSPSWSSAKFRLSFHSFLERAPIAATIKPSARNTPTSPSLAPGVYPEHRLAGRRFPFYSR